MVRQAFPRLAVGGEKGIGNISDNVWGRGGYALRTLEVFLQFEDLPCFPFELNLDNDREWVLVETECNFGANRSR